MGFLIYAVVGLIASYTILKYTYHGQDIVYTLRDDAGDALVGGFAIAIAFLWPSIVLGISLYLAFRTVGGLI